MTDEVPTSVGQPASNGAALVTDAAVAIGRASGNAAAASVAGTQSSNGYVDDEIRSVAIANDHRGVRVKQQIADQLRGRGIEVVDFGADNDEACDYPDYARPVAEAVAGGSVQRGILICGTGMGMTIAANKFRGIRAVAIHDDVTAEISRRHNDANVLCLSANLLGDRLLGRMVEVWLETPFDGGRHQKRLEKVRAAEEGLCGDATGVAKAS